MGIALDSMFVGTMVQETLLTGSLYLKNRNNWITSGLKFRFKDHFLSSTKCPYLYPSLTVPNLLPQEDELAIHVRLGDHSWSFLVILAMTMTMTINSNSVLLIRVTSADQHESFEHVQKCYVPSVNNFHSCLCALKTCSYHLCHTAYVLYSSHSNSILHHSCM